MGSRFKQVTYERRYPNCQQANEKAVTPITPQGSTVLKQNEILLHIPRMAKKTEKLQVFVGI